MIFWYTGLLGDIRLQTKSKVIDGASNVHIVDKRFDFEESIIIFRPFLVKNQYELHFVNRCGHISRTLSTDCVVEFDAPVFGMCRSGDIRGLRDAFYSGSVSFNVVDPYGNGLLHVSTLPRPLSSPSDS